MADENNQGAPATEVNNSGADNAAAAPQTATSAAGTEGAPKDTANNGASAEPAFDPRTSYEGLVKQLEQVSKSYKNLHGEFTRRTQYEAELKKQIETLSKAFAEATRTEVTPEAFMKSLQTQGLKAFDPLREQWTKEIKDNYDKQLSERDEQLTQFQNNFELKMRELDSVHYPDFAKLKPVMHEIAESPNCPIDWNQPLGVIYDTLYKLAKDHSADNAIKKARDLGKKEAEAQSAKEAKTAVPGGGKTAGSTTPDLDKITDIKKLRELVAAMHGVADR